ncbi:MAG TPA: hypothetical protein VIX81_05130 [Gammaproteobacteria bacterium]
MKPNRTPTVALLLLAALFLGGCAAPSALTVVAIGAKFIRHDLEQARTRPGPITVDELLLRARGELAWPQQREVQLSFEPDALELDDGQRERMVARLTELASDSDWQADLLAGPAAEPGTANAALLAYRRARGVEQLLVPGVQLRSVRYLPSLPRDRVVLNLRPLPENPRA